MSPRARTTAPKRTGSTTSRASTAKRGKGHTALDRLTKSVDAAQDALKDLRGEMGRGSSGALKEIDKQLKDARKNLRGASKSVLKDLEGLQQKLAAGSGAGAKKTTSSARKTGGSSARKTAGTSARKTSTGSSARKASASSARKGTASKSGGTRARSASTASRGSSSRSGTARQTARGSKKS